MSKKFPITVILENVRSALNVGAIFRTCDGANVQKLILTGITPYPPHNRIPKTALGAIATVDWVQERNSQKIIDEIATNMPLIAVEITSQAQAYTDFTFPSPVAIVLGNEISGVSQLTLKKAKAVVKIPMYGSKESLNVATSCGIILFEILRQWRELHLISQN